MSSSGSAPTFAVPPREVVGLEHPMIIKNIDNGLRTLGTGVPLYRLLDSDNYDGCFPLYLRPVDPTCAPLLSYNTPSNNVLLKITVPKRTGRKRKRGSDGPYTLDSATPARNAADETTNSSQSTNLRSHSRFDSPKDLLQTLKDNVGKYHIEPVGHINQTHRYRGITDFYHSTAHGTFMTKFRDSIVPGTLESVKKFKLDPHRGVRENEELIPPPTLSDKFLPVNWGYHQNSTVKVTTDQTTGETTLQNKSHSPKLSTYYVTYDTKTVPTKAPELPAPDPILENLIARLREEFVTRPMWTRRALMNRVPKDYPGTYLLKQAIQYVGYQFRGGPWRDAIVTYGLDPRTDPAYRIYQTIFFQIIPETEEENAVGRAWHDMRSEFTRKANPETLAPDSHVFDGTSISFDGKGYQICDITDPLLVRLFSTKTLRKECDIFSDGWFCNGTLAKARAIMRTKIHAIRMGRGVDDSEFRLTLAMPDDVKGKSRITAYMPNLRPKDTQSDAEEDDMLLDPSGMPYKGRAWRRRKMKNYNRRYRKGMRRRRKAKNSGVSLRACLRRWGQEGSGFLDTLNDDPGPDQSRLTAETSATAGRVGDQPGERAGDEGDEEDEGEEGEEDESEDDESEDDEEDGSEDEDEDDQEDDGSEGEDEDETEEGEEGEDEDVDVDDDDDDDDDGDER